MKVNTPVILAGLSTPCSASIVANYRRCSPEAAISTNTAPHALLLSSEDIGEGETWRKALPIIREGGHTSLFYGSFCKPFLDTISCHHHSVRKDLKTDVEGDFFRAAAGASTLPFSLSAAWTFLVRNSKKSDPEAEINETQICKLAQKMSTRPAELLGIGAKKGRIAQGMSADFVVFDTDAIFTV